MTVMVENYVHERGEHCASTALRNILAHQGTRLSEGMVFGLASGLGFYYLRSDDMSPTRMFHGRTLSLENDFGRNADVPLEDLSEGNDETAWVELRRSIDRGEPVMVSTDTFYLGYHNTTSHFPGHRCVVVGYDDESETVLIADRKFEEYQRCSFEELSNARNAPDYPMTCHNQRGVATGPLSLGRPLGESIRTAIGNNARAMLEPADEYPAGIPAMRALAADLPSWSEASDWSWASRFGYQVVIKRGAGGSFFRSLYADFLREAAVGVPEVAAHIPAERMDAIARRWRDLAAILEEQSECSTCDPMLFEAAGKVAADLADIEERFFEDALRVGDGD